MDTFIVGCGFITLWVLLVVVCCWPRCRHQWEKSEVKEYPPAAPAGMSCKNMWSDDIIKLKQSHTTYVQRCSKCGIERYHTERRP